MLALIASRGVGGLTAGMASSASLEHLVSE
jgi:hypothetical protein